MNELSRRSFLKGAGISAAALVGTGGISVLTGCSPQSGSEIDGGGGVATDGGSPVGNATSESGPSYMNRPAIGEPTETVQADFIVCGAGGAGMAAALQANDLGLNVILLEKKAQAGGTFAFAGVYYAPNNKYAVAEGMTQDLNEIIMGILSYNHYIPSYTLLKKYMVETAETVDWVEGNGGQFSSGGGAFGGIALGYAGESAGGATLGGASIIKALIEEAERRGLDIRYSTAAQELVQDGSGKITGVLATDDSGKVIKFETSAVFLCTGGWGNNADFLREVGRVDPDRVISSGYDGRDGDGVYMARRAGAAWARGDGTIMFYGPHLLGATWGDHLYRGVYQPELWVDQNGKRFMNESSGNQMEVGLAIRDLPRMLIINSQAGIDRITAQGGLPELGGVRGNSGEFSGGNFLEFKDLLQRQIDAGNEYVFIADTIEELATTADLDTATFKATVDRYNEAAEKGVDEDFGKDPRCLIPLKEGPFYAFDCFNGFYTTVGGIRINDDLLAVDESGNVIEGLYVGGCDTGALCGDIYDFTSAPGEQSSWALNSGRMAAKHVAEVLKK